jgi:single-strand DNA-binding protein
VANVNKVILVGRLTRDPETRTFTNGGKVANFGFAVSNRRKNAQTGQWEDEPMFIDCKAFNRGDSGRLADTIEQYLKKGSLVYLEGKLHLESWDDKQTGAKRTKHALYVDVMQMLDGRGEGGGRGLGGPRQHSQATHPADSYNDSHGGDDDSPHSGAGGSANEEIPF